MITGIGIGLAMMICLVVGFTFCTHIARRASKDVLKDCVSEINDQRAIIASLDAALLRMSKRDYPPTDN